MKHPPYITWPSVILLIVSMMLRLLEAYPQP